MKQSFGKIYGGKNPTHGVYTENSLHVWGERAVAISHHFSEKSAEEIARSETVIRGAKCIAVEYETENLVAKINL